MIMKIRFYIFILAFQFLTMSFPQQTELNTKTSSRNNNQIDTEVFRDIEEGIQQSNVSAISKYFGPQTYFSFSNGINGYYSSNQAFYVLEDFFEVYKVTTFKFDHIKGDKNSGYATGKYSYDNRGKRNSAQVYISLKKVGNNWNITQLTIN